MRIGLYGGSFNPAHAGHRHVSLLAMKRVRLDRVWWVVTPGNPLKERGGLAPACERAAAAQALARHPRIDITCFEEEIGARYTVETLAYVAGRCPTVRFVWIMGADNLAHFDRWQRWREIFTMVPVAVVDRPGWRLKALASKAARRFASNRIPESEAATLSTRPPPTWTFLTGPLSHVSSTAIRNQAKGRRSASVAKRTQTAPELPWRKRNSGPEALGPHADSHFEQK
jgi:nicotinate-nucleotide adenylyltransferase